MRKITPHVAQVAEYYAERIVARSKQHGLPLTDESTAALFAALTCLHSAVNAEIVELREIAMWALETVVATSEAHAQERQP